MPIAHGAVLARVPTAAVPVNHARPTIRAACHAGRAQRYRDQVDPIAGDRVHVQGVPISGYSARAPEAARGRILRVTVVGENVLHRPCKPAVAEIGTPELYRLIDDMFATMYVAEGVGLAANQVDVDLQLFVYDCHDDVGVRHVGHIVNPVLQPVPPRERRLVEESEGCLSVPGASFPLARASKAIVRGQDKDGNDLVIEGTGYFARCLLHETDHLNGLLYIDRLTKRERRSVLQEMGDVMADVFERRAARAREAGPPGTAGRNIPAEPPGAFRAKRISGNN